MARDREGKSAKKKEKSREEGSGSSGGDGTPVRIDIINREASTAAAPAAATNATKKEITLQGGGPMPASGNGGTATYSLALALRIVLFMFSVVGWAVMVSLRNFDAFSSFEFLVATGVIITFWSIVGILTELAARGSSFPNVVRVYASCEVIIDALLWLLSYAAFVSVASVQHINFLNTRTDSLVICSIVFTAFSWVTLSVTVLCTFIPAWRNMHTANGATVLGTMTTSGAIIAPKGADDDDDI